MHLLFALFAFSLIFEIVIAICVALFCNSPFCVHLNMIWVARYNFVVLDRRVKAV